MSQQMEIVQDSFANDDIDYSIDTEDNDNLHCWRVDMEEEVA